MSLFVFFMLLTYTGIGVLSALLLFFCDLYIYHFNPWSRHCNSRIHKVFDDIGFYTIGVPVFWFAFVPWWVWVHLADIYDYHYSGRFTKFLETSLNQLFGKKDNTED